MFRSCGPDGKCYAFDHRAQGYGRGEGGAILVLKRLDDALEHGDPIRAVIRETAMNQDGKSQTITSPDEHAQYELIETCYRKAGLDPLETVVAEAHGTGTRAGDPVEAAAIGRALRPPHRGRRSPPVRVASVKTNIGHTEAVSGLASIIKMAKSLEHRKIAPSLNFEKPNPDIDLDALGLKVRSRLPQMEPVKKARLTIMPRQKQVVTELEDWPTGRALRASVNNFGYGGTNVHAIVDASPRPMRGPTEALTMEDTPKLFIVSARAPKTVRKMLSDLRRYLEERGSTAPFAQLAYTLGQRRSRFPYVAALSASSRDDLLRSLEEAPVEDVRAPTAGARLAFVFNGQGAQWFAMGRELMSAYPSYLSALRRCDEAIKAFGAQWSIVGRSATKVSPFHTAVLTRSQTQRN